MPNRRGVISAEQPQSAYKWKHEKAPEPRSVKEIAQNIRFLLLGALEDFDTDVLSNALIEQGKDLVAATKLEEMKIEVRSFLTQHSSEDQLDGMTRNDLLKALNIRHHEITNFFLAMRRLMDRGKIQHSNSIIFNEEGRLTLIKDTTRYCISEVGIELSM